MTSGWQERVELERQWLQSLRADSPAMAQVVAEDVVDALDREIDEETEDGLIWDVAEGLQQTLLMEVSTQFEKAIESSVLQTLENRSRQLAQVLGEEWTFDPDRAALDNLRKSLRLVPRLKPYIDSMFQRAKPGVATLLFRAVKDDIEDMEKEWQADGEKLRSAFERERLALQKEIAQIAEEIIQRLRLYYQQALEELGAGAA